MLCSVSELVYMPFVCLVALLWLVSFCSDYCLVGFCCCRCCFARIAALIVSVPGILVKMCDRIRIHTGMEGVTVSSGGLL